MDLKYGGGQSRLGSFDSGKGPAWTFAHLFKDYELKSSWTVFKQFTHP